MSYANIVKNGGSIQIITDKVLTEAKIRSSKEMNVIISMIDNKAVIINSVKLFSKKENKLTNKVVVTFSSKDVRDHIIKL